MRDVPVIDSFQFFGPNQIPASISLRVEWRASGPFARRGSGTNVPETDMAAFLGDIAPGRPHAQRRVSLVPERTLTFASTEKSVG